jgi:hypothetical protein
MTSYIEAVEKTIDAQAGKDAEIERLKAQVKELRGQVGHLRAVMRLALNLSRTHDDFKLWGMEPFVDLVEKRQ